MIAFIGIDEDKTVVNHIDCDPLNNCIENLEWVTYRENVLHAYENNRIPKQRGSKNTNSILTDDEAQSIINIYAEGELSMRGVARLFPQVSFTTVRKIINGLKWPHLKRPIYK
jgi:hypothetical protein